MKWLHISDFHVDSSYIAKRNTDFFSSFFNGLRSQVEKKSVDFIVFTGDLFNQGKWNKGQKDAALLFLNDVYRICSDVCSWNWNTGDALDRLFYCPGNHDVFRDAYHIEDDSFVITRSNILESIRNANNPLSPKDGCFCSMSTEQKIERQVLTEHTFSLFDKAMQNCGDYWAGNNNMFLYEFRSFHLPNTIESKKTAIVGLNTSLLTGLPFSQEVINKELMETWTEFEQSHAMLDFRKAQAAYRKYQRAYEKQQGFLRDDEKHICFISPESADTLKNHLTSYEYPILFGHHPISFFSDDAREKFLRFAKDVQAQIYLCGHIHKPEVTVFHHGRGLNLFDVYSFAVGGIFVDETKYNEVNFAIHELQYEPRPKLTVSVYTYIRDEEDLFGFDRCVERTNTLELKTPTAIDTNTTPKPAEKRLENTQVADVSNSNIIDISYQKNTDDHSNEINNKTNSNTISHNAIVKEDTNRWIAGG